MKNSELQPATAAWVFLALALTLGLSGRGWAESAVSSDAIGYYRKTLVPGFQAVSATMIEAPVFTSRIDGSTAGTITSTYASANFGTLLVPGTAYYVELTKGPAGVNDAHAGHRFEIDEAATVAAGNNQLVIDAESGANTRSGVPEAVGYYMEVRPHLTLNGVFDKTKFVGGTSLATADQLLIFNGSTYDTYYLFASGEVRLWVRFGGSLTSQDGKPLFPGQGMLFKRVAGAAPVEIVIKGRVRSNPFVQPLHQGFNLISEGFPVSVSPADRDAAPGNFTGSVSVNSADQIAVFTGATYDTYYLFKSGTFSAWLKLGGSGTHDQNDIFDYRGSVFLRRIAADTNYRAPLPWQP